jgi:hypothetical protein
MDYWGIIAQFELVPTDTEMTRVIITPDLLLAHFLSYVALS